MVLFFWIFSQDEHKINRLTWVSFGWNVFLLNQPKTKRSMDEGGKKLFNHWKKWNFRTMVFKSIRIFTIFQHFEFCESRFIFYCKIWKFHFFPTCSKVFYPPSNFKIVFLWNDEMNKTNKFFKIIPYVIRQPFIFFVQNFRMNFLSFLNPMESMKVSKNLTNKLRKIDCDLDFFSQRKSMIKVINPQ